ncbi:MAG: single-stranded DNA-binding protein [Clostridia bacterium]|nr:single-stranded DNA-binding protein [Clostridia bacterium]
MANFNFNKVILGGRLTGDPELKTTQSGVSVTSFSVAVNRRYSGTADQQPQADFINVVAWRQQAEFVSRYFRKGSSICVVGSLQTRSWTDQNGQKRYATEVVADEINFVDSKGENPASRQGGASYGAAPAAAPYTPASYGGSSYAGTPDNAPRFEEMSNEDDLPF